MDNNMKVIREKKGLTQQECADNLGITLRAWQTYEQGVREPKYAVLLKIADYFGVSLDYLLGREPLPDPFADIELKESAVDDICEAFKGLPKEKQAAAVDVLLTLSKAVDNAEKQCESIEDHDECIENCDEHIESHDERSEVSNEELEDLVKYKRGALGMLP